jgi:TonB-linked SusC/RagA family outer membrane protein
VTGKVTSAEDGSALPGVNVVVKGTTSGTVTDAQGNFKIVVPADGGTLIFTFIGLTTSELVVGSRQNINVQMAADVTQLSEVVVTALGVQRESKTLPYATQTVGSDQLNIARANNINDALAGKIAGIQVRGQSGAALGRNASIRIRGAGSLTDKAPLYVVDGTPVGDVDRFGNAVNGSVDFNPDDVESVNVLKGPSATALYGQRGDAGVILITTKKGSSKSKGLGVTLTQNLFFDNIYVLPKYQNSYAGGASPDLEKFTWTDGMPTEWQALDGAYYHDYTDDASWGPRMTGQQYIPWYAWVPGTKYTGKTTALTPQPNNVRDFYETGVNSSTNLSFARGNEDTNVRLSYTNQNQKGVMPNTSLLKNTVALNFTTKLSKWLEVGANINYVNTLTNGEFDDAYSNQSTGSFNSWFHRNLEMDKMRELQNLKAPGGQLVSWNHFNPNYYVGDSDGDGVINGDKFYRGYYWYNPFTYFNSIDYQQTRDRLFGHINATFNITDNLKASLFYRKNQTTGKFENKRPSILPYSFYTENRPTGEAQWDFYGTGQNYVKEDNLEFLVAYTDRFMGDKLSLDLSAGGNRRSESSSSVNMNTSLGLTVPNLYTISNSKNPQFGYNNARYAKQVNSLYGRGTIGYNETFFLDFSLRNDWSSALPAAKNSYMYPSVGVSAIFSEFTGNILPVLSFGKLRGSWAQVGSDLAPYQLDLNYAVGANQWNGNAVMSTPDKLVDPNIKPSLSSAIEVGIDLKFIKNRIGFSATFFADKKINEILEVGVTGASGFNTKLINAGQIDRNVIELQLDGTPIKTSDFEWNIMLNYSKVESIITELVPNISAIPAIGNASYLASTFHVEGKEWGQIRGVTIQRDANGTPILDPETGLYRFTDDPADFGSVLPEFTGGVVNSFRYKNFSVNASIDFQKGGKFFSVSDMWGSFSGLTERTAGVNNLGNPIRDAVVDGGGVHVVGVDEDGTPVDMYVGAQDYYHQFYFGNILDPHIYDLTFVKLRELSVGYQIPVQKLGAVGKIFTSANLSIVGRNLWLMNANDLDFDPSEISGSFGENGQMPSSRSYGFSLKLSF